MEKVENHCAALCTAKEHSCTGFYIEDTTAGSCHLVNEGPNDSLNIGHGWRWLDVSGIDCFLLNSITVFLSSGFLQQDDGQ